MVETGGGLRRYRAGGREVLDGYAEDEMCSGGRGAPLLPWPNRLADGRYEWRGRTYQLALSEPATSTAIHGLTRWQPWQVLASSTDGITVGHHLLPHPGYPWSLEVAITYRLGDDGLAVRTEVVNRSDEPAPFGLGYHPYLSAAGGLVDGCTLTIPAAAAYESDSRGLPVSTHDVEGTDDDFRSARAIGDRHLDLTLTDLERGDDGRARVRFTDPAGAVTAVWVDEAFGHLQVFSGDTLAVDRRRRGLAVEAMTGPANLLATGVGLVTLDPGEPWVGEWGIIPG